MVRPYGNGACVYFCYFAPAARNKIHDVVVFLTKRLNVLESSSNTCMAWNEIGDSAQSIAKDWPKSASNAKDHKSKNAEMPSPRLAFDFASSFIRVPQAVKYTG